MRENVRHKTQTILPDVYEAIKKDFQNGVVITGDVCSADCFFCTLHSFMDYSGWGVKLKSVTFEGLMAFSRSACDQVADLSFGFTR